MMQQRQLGAWVLALGLLAATAPARAAEYNQLQPSQSAVSFVYQQMNVPIQGSFKRFKGELGFDPVRPEAGKVSMEIDLASIDAGFPEANDELAGRLWFDIANYPVARFDATSIRPLGNNLYEVSGKLRIKGRTRDAKVQASFRAAGNTGVFEGAFVIRRADFGIGEGIWADFGTVANEVQIRFRMTAAAAARK